MSLEDGDDNSPVTLNVGGQLFTTHKLTLTSGSTFFASKFSGRWNQDKIEFLDRDSVGFAHVLNLLRDPGYPFPLDRYEHELKFYGVRSQQTSRQEELLFLRPRHHRTTPLEKTSVDTLPFGLTSLLCRNSGSFVPLDRNELGPLAQPKLQPAFILSRRVLFSQTSSARVSIPADSESPFRDCWMFRARWKEADAWDEPRLVLSYESPTPIVSRQDFYRLGLLSKFLSAIELYPSCKTSSLAWSSPWASLPVETLESILLGESEMEPSRERPSLQQAVFAECPNEIVVPIARIFKLGGMFSEECDVAPFCQDFLQDVCFVVRRSNRPSEPFRLLDCRLTMNRYLFDDKLRRVVNHHRIVPVNELAPEAAPETDRALDLAMIDWAQESWAIPAGSTEFEESKLKGRLVAGILQELLFFSIERETGRYVRSKSFELQFNGLSFTWTERELVDCMEDARWTPSSPIYKLNFETEATHLNSISNVGFRIHFWEPLTREVDFYVGVKRQLRMSRDSRKPWPHGLRPLVWI